MRGQGRGAVPLGKSGRATEIVVPFVVVVLVMIGMCAVSMDIMSGARAFVGGESRWSKGQKLAVLHLERYLSSYAESDYRDYLDAIAIPLGDRRARDELDKPKPDDDIVRTEFERGGIADDDIPGMSRLYRHFSDMAPIHRAVLIWREGDRRIDELVAIGHEVRARYLRGDHDREWTENTLEHIRRIDARLTPLEEAFSEALGKASRQTANLLRWLIGLTGCLMVLVAAGRTRRLLADRAKVARALQASEDRFQLAVDGSSDGIWDWDRRNRRLYLSPRLQDMLDVHTPEPCAPELVFGRLHPQDRIVARRIVLAHVRHGSPLDVQFRIDGTHGDFRWFHARGTSLRDGRGTSTRMAGSVTEITEKRLADALLYAEKERAEVTLQSIGDAVITTNAAGLIAYLNPSAERLTGRNGADAVGRDVSDICRVVDEATLERLPDPFAQVLRECAPWSSVGKLLLERVDGTLMGVDITATPIRDRNGGIDGAVLIIRDVSSDREHAAMLSYQASHDGLTGLINRREFERRLALATRVAAESTQPLTVLYLDLDQFKVINDTCSHAAGDELLRQIAALFTKEVRQTDAVARLGGDEFVVLLENCGADDGMKIAENLRMSVGDLHFAFRDRAFSLSASIGLVSLVGDRLTREDILGAADAACHLAKEKGRNRVQAYHLGDDEVATRQSEMGWVSRIQAALTDDRFVLLAQEIIDLRGPGQGHHVELLLRMVEEDGALIPPRAFIPAAERYGLMPSIDRWVVDAAFGTLRHRLEHQPAQVPDICAINLSGMSLCEDGFSDFLRRQFIAHRVPPSSICFEITETAAISSLSRATVFINEMRALGCRFSLDDFGAGMSSFTYLKHLPVDFVKIDGSFVKDMIDDPTDLAMVQAINNIGHVTGKLTIAECVSCPELLLQVERMGIDFAQGFAISAPLMFTPRPSRRQCAIALDEPA
ncbi:MULTISPECIES: EAL domain-containing protein [Dyella]|uniref:EAL domain-containing protein n=2 Tax=Dyella TaxID=231454 RepID=A0A4R0YGW8_9GAMM|nr:MULTISPECIES: EAL domain-containing protein [Dyella]TBR37258.1 EAL domain-containing protein [Dyella terrae]TCI07652.1 EAL domain-containing protein [Dyella soli]